MSTETAVAAGEAAASGADWRTPVTLGRTGLRVGRLGLGASYGAPTAAYEEAFERGLNYFYLGTRRHPTMLAALHVLAPRAREKLVVAVQSYTRVGALLAPSLWLALRKARLDYADVLLLGLWNGPVWRGVLDAALRLQEKGLVRHLAISAHERPAFGAHLAGGAAGLLHVRYNAAHRGAEQEVFPLLPAERAARPGVLTFTTTRWGYLLDPARLPAGERVPRGRDPYRFALTHPDVDAAMCGPASRAQLQEALAALEEGPMSPDELAWMRRLGDHVRGQSIADTALKKMIRT
jgi:aryl-alcohol dehydrogenase-like predicted oxidoreductase